MKKLLSLLMLCAALSCTKETIPTTGSILIVNNSSNPYDVFINGALEINDMPGESVQNFDKKPTGSYSIRIKQVSGYLIYPTEKTYEGTLSDKGTLVISFPD